MSYCNYGYVMLGEIVRRVSGMSLDTFARERIFAPLGMTDTFYVVPESVRHRIVKRPPDAPGAEDFNSREWEETPWGSAGVYSTAKDMAIFGQVFLNEGRCGDARILSPAGAASMTRNQIPGIGARYGEETFTEASWGFGWNVRGTKNDAGNLLSPRTFSHGGAGGVFLWADPAQEIVGVYFSVTTGRATESGTKPCTEPFINAVMEAIIDE
jgi:CubicO group peptidase (beta-lactamase class C family)